MSADDGGGGSQDGFKAKNDLSPTNDNERSLSTSAYQTINLDAEESEIPESRPKPSSSTPINIRQASCGKFGVLHTRVPAMKTAGGSMIDANGEPVSLDKLIKTANTMSSLMMAHKIALEDDFKLEPGMDITGPLMSLSPIIGSSPSQSSNTAAEQQEPSLHSRVKDIVHDAYWDLFKEELDSQAAEDVNERKYDVSLQLLSDIKQKILELLLPQHERLKQDIDDKLDPKIFHQLAQVHMLELTKYGHYILSVLSKLCAPVRDERLKELADARDLVQLYRGIMELLELMRLDFANFTLNQFKPHIRAHSLDYEREKFTEILLQQKTLGIDGLEYTRIWLARAVASADAIHGIMELVNESSADHTPITLEQDQRDIDRIRDQEPSVSTKFEGSYESGSEKHGQILNSEIVNKVLNVAYCELLEWDPSIQKLYPETLLFDESTFKQLSEQYKVLLLTASILLTTFAFVKNLRIPESNEFKLLVKSHIITLLTATYDRPQQHTTKPTHIDRNNSNDNNTAPISAQLPPVIDNLDSVKLETVAMKLCDDIRNRIRELNRTDDLLENFENQKQIFNRQILDLQNSSNRIRELARRRIIEFVETLLDLDVKYQQKKFPSKMPPPVNIPLGLNCLTDEITLTMAQLVKIIRYNRKVFFQHYQDIIVEQVSKFL